MASKADGQDRKENEDPEMPEISMTPDVTVSLGYGLKFKGSPDEVKEILAEFG